MLLIHHPLWTGTNKCSCCFLVCVCQGPAAISSAPAQRIDPIKHRGQRSLELACLGVPRQSSFQAGLPVVAQESRASKPLCQVGAPPPRTRTPDPIPLRALAGRCRAEAITVRWSQGAPGTAPSLWRGSLPFKLIDQTIQSPTLRSSPNAPNGNESTDISRQPNPERRTIKLCGRPPSANITPHRC
jgi:hypothetical protein